MIGLTLLIVLSNLLTRSDQTWATARTFIILLPVFFTSNVISDEYENHREGFVFVTSTPIYKQSIVKFVYGFLLSHGFILLAYLSAYAVGLETTFSHWFTIIVCSLFLSLLGMTVANLTKQSLLGVGVSLIYWTVMATLGYSLNEDLWFISVVLNIGLTSQVVWNNVWSLLGLSYVLILVNIWIIGKGEKIRKPLLITNVSLIIVAVGLMGGYQYKLGQGASTSSHLISSIHKKENLVVLAGADQVVETELIKRNIPYVVSQNIQPEDLKQHNVILISSNEKVIEDAILKSLESEVKITMTEMGINVEGKEIYHGDAYRLISENPVNTNKSVLYLNARKWTEGSFSYLLDHISEGLLVLQEGKPVATSNFIKGQSPAKRLELLDKGWFVKGDATSHILFKNLAEAKANQFLKIWQPISEHVNKMLPKDMQMHALQIIDAKLDQALSSEVLSINYDSMKELEPYRLGGRDWIEKISTSMLSQTYFKNIENPELRFVFSKYILLNKLAPQIEAAITPHFWKEQYEVSLAIISRDAQEEGQHYVQNPDFINRETANSLIYYLLNQVERSSQLDSLLKELSSLHTVSDKQVKGLFASYLSPTEVDKIFGLYEEKTK